MDIDIVRAGAIVICPVKVKGGGIYMGDMHALQGDGEIAGHTAMFRASSRCKFTCSKGCRLTARFFFR